MAKVLLVEDDNNLREIYQARLMAEGYDIVTAQNGEEALVMAKQNKPDLVISDVMMPRISGFEMLDILRNTTELKHTKVIMLTALGQAEDQERANSLGADKYLIKSQVTLEDIVDAARHLLADDEDILPTPEPTPIETAPVPVMPEPAAPVESAAVVPDAVTTPAPEAVATPSESVMPTPEMVQPAPIIQPMPEVAMPVPAAPSGPTTEPTNAPSVAIDAPATAVTTVVPNQTTSIAPTDPQANSVADLPEPATLTDTTPQIVAAPLVDAPAEPPIDLPTPVDTQSEPLASADHTPVEPEEVPAPQQDSVVPSVDPNSSPALREAQTIEAEEAALQAQIDNYASSAVGTPPDAAATDTTEETTDTQTDEPNQSVAPADTTESDDSSNDATIAEAVEELNSTAVEVPIQPPSVVHAEQLAAAEAPATAPAVVPAAPDAAAPNIPVAEAPAEQPTPAPEEPVTTTPPSVAGDPDAFAPQSVAGKKVIRPISNPSNAPNLDELLAKEAAQTPAPAAAPVIGGSPTSPVSTANDQPIPPAMPGQSFDPNSVAL